MGQDATRREIDYRASAVDVWDLEFTHGTTSAKNAMLASVEAAVQAVYWKMYAAIRDDILEKAEDLDGGDSDLAEDGPAALIWYAQLLDETLPADYKLEVS